MADASYDSYRRELYDLFVTLAASRDRCRQLHAVLPVSPHEDEMLEGKVPPDFPTEVRGTLECVLSDFLNEHLLTTLREASKYGLEPASPAAA